MTALHVLVPDGVDDPARPSGGNRYDLRACAELRAAGRHVHLTAVPGGWPHPAPDGDARKALYRWATGAADGHE